MKKVIIHCGFRKAGSTTIQRLLRAERKNISQKVGLIIRDDVTEDFRRIAMRYVRQKDTNLLLELPAAAEKIAEKIRASNNQVNIISDENLIGSSVFHSDGTDIFDWAAEILPILERSLWEFSLTFYFVTRNSAAWIKSAYQQEVYNNYLTLTFDEWRAQFAGEIDWLSGMKKIRKTLHSKCEVREMEDLLLESPILGRDILLTAGVDKGFVDSLNNPGRANVRVSANAIQFIRYLNASSLSKKQIMEVRKLIEKNKDIFN